MTTPTRGRPRVTSPRSTTISCHVSLEEDRYLTRLASQRGITKSALVRSLVLDDEPSRPTAYPDVVARLVQASGAVSAEERRMVKERAEAAGLSMRMYVRGKVVGRG